MVTTRKTSDSKVIAMEDKTGGATVPPKTLLEEVNTQLMCVLCRGYYIDATTIVECLHSFCRSCIIKHLQVKSYCPICEMMINSAKPNIKPDKALQDIVYKLVPGLFQREMQRRQSFYASRPGSAANATPEQRGEDTERIIFSPEDVISFSLEYMDCTETESASSRSSESGNESTPCNEGGAPTRRYLQCPAVVNISHLKKFLSMKYDVDAAHFYVDILYKRVPLPDYYTLMDIAYIYNWKRNEPMRFFYQISDFSAIRDRFGFFGLNRPGSLASGRKGVGDRALASPAPASPAPSQLTEGGSDASSGSFSPIPHDKIQTDFSQDSDSKIDLIHRTMTDGSSQDSCSNPDLQASPLSSSSVDVEKSQFLNSFELTAKCSAGSGKCSDSPSKDSLSQEEKSTLTEASNCSFPKCSSDALLAPKSEIQASPNKRKSSPAEESPDTKKVKFSLDKTTKDSSPNKCKDVPIKVPCSSDLSQTSKSVVSNPVPTASKNVPVSGVKSINKAPLQTVVPENTLKVEDKSPKLPAKIPTTSGITSLDSTSKKVSQIVNKPSPVKRKISDDSFGESQTLNQVKSASIPKLDPPKTTPISQPKIVEPRDMPSPNISKPATNFPKTNMMPRIPNKVDNILRPSEPKKDVQNFVSTVGLKPPLRLQSPKTPKSQGDPLKSLFDSCNINIPSSLSITLTDQKSDQTSNDGNDNDDPMKQSNNGAQLATSQTQTNFQSKPQPAASQVSSFIEILKIPETEPNTKTNEDKTAKPSHNSKPTEGPVSAKGPVPNLKPIADAKQMKSTPITKPQTFQQTFLQSLQQQSEKPKFIKTRIDFPKTTNVQSKNEEDSTNPTKTVVNPAAVAAASAKFKPMPMAQPIRKPNPLNQPKVVKSDSALDLSTPHTFQSQLGPQQSKTLETMQSIANIAKRQSLNQRMTSPSQVFSQDSFKMNTANASPIRIPAAPPHNKLLKANSSTQVSSANSPKHHPEYFQPLKSNVRSSNNGSPNLASKPMNSQPVAAFNQRSQTRSPSSSPKLVIACPSPNNQSPEEKQLLSPRSSSDVSSQSSMISSSHISSTNHANNEPTSAKDSSKSGPMKNQGPSKSAVRNPNSGNHNKAGGSGSNVCPPQSDLTVLAQQEYLRRQLELQTQLGLLPPGAAAQWYNNPVARAHFENIMKNMTHNPSLPFGSNHPSKNNK